MLNAEEAKELSDKVRDGNESFDSWPNRTKFLKIYDSLIKNDIKYGYRHKLVFTSLDDDIAVSVSWAKYEFKKRGFRVRRSLLGLLFDLGRTLVVSW